MVCRVCEKAAANFAAAFFAHLPSANGALSFEAWGNRPGLTNSKNVQR
jgi:hypothetical protein